MPPNDDLAFVASTDKLMPLSKETIDRRLAEYKSHADQNPRERGLLLLSFEMPVLVRNGVVIALLIGLHSVYRWHRDRAVPAPAPPAGSPDAGEDPAQA